MSKIIVLLSTDLFTHGIGGLCTQLRETVKEFALQYPEYYFWVAATDFEAYSGPNWEVLPIVDVKPRTMTRFNEYLHILNRSACYVGSVMNQVVKTGQTPCLIHAFDWGTFTAGHILASYFQCPFITTVALSIQEEVKAYQKHIFDKMGLNDMTHLQILQMAQMVEVTGLLKCNHIIITCEKYAQRVTGPFYFKTSVIPNGIPLQEIQNIKIPNDFTLPGTPENKKLIFIGRFTVSKNIGRVIQVNLPPQTDLIIIGHPTKGADPHIYNSILKKCQENTHIYYVGPKYDEEKFIYLKSADAIIMPSIHEPFGIVALEALAADKPLLCSMVDGLGEFLNDQVCIPCGTEIEELQASIEKWRKMDNLTLQILAEKRQEFIKNFSWTRVVQQIHQLYDSYINSKNLSSSV